MLFIDRERAPAPSFFNSPAAQAARRDAEIFFKVRKLSRLQQRFEFLPPAAVGEKLLPALRNLFRRKCVYCETPVGISSPGEIDLFRPKWEALGLIPTNWKITNGRKNWLSLTRKESDRDGYWWLAYEWDNTLLACAYCSRNKGTQFPVLGQRVAPGTIGQDLRNERALLIDPCTERPHRYLCFAENGMVAGRKLLPQESHRFQSLNRGEITIDVLGLNRRDLVESRKKTLADLYAQWNRRITPGRVTAAVGDYLSEFIDPNLPYAGMRHQFITQWALDFLPVLSEKRRESFSRALRSVQGFEEQFELLERKRKRESTIISGKDLVRLAFGPSRQRTTGFITSVRIQNFKAIRNLMIKIPAGSEERAGWTVMLGENGAGKSSILQAVALALMGPRFVRRYLKEFHLRPRDLLRKSRGARTVTQATITVEFSTGRQSVLQFRPNKFTYLKLPPRGIFLRGFGATRLMPRRNMPAIPISKGTTTKVTNLFDPVEPVFDAETWLAGLKNRIDFGTAALSLKDLLDLPGFAKIHVRGRKVRIPMEGLQHSLDELSAGYESVLVMAADIIAGHLGQNQDLRQATGIVLIDEIDAHLHPRWKMKIVESLRRTFSSMQFLVTTHEPLCLRGVGKGEVIVLERVGKDVTAFDDLPAPNSLRVDQLLTSNFFGLGSTIDPTIEREFDRYYDLLARPSGELTTAEKQERLQLREKLAQYEYRLMGSTPREELLYEAIDQYVAKDVQLRGAARVKLPALRHKTKRRIAALWRNYQQAGGRNP